MDQKAQITSYIAVLAGIFLCAGLFFIYNISLVLSLLSGAIGGLGIGLLLRYQTSMVLISLTTLVYIGLFGIIAGIFFQALRDFGGISLTGFIVFIALLMVVFIVQVGIFQKILVMRDKQSQAKAIRHNSDCL